METEYDLKRRIEDLVDESLTIERSTVDFGAIPNKVPTVDDYSKKYPVQNFTDYVWLDEHSIGDLLERGWLWVSEGIYAGEDLLFWRVPPEIHVQQDFATYRWKAQLYFRLAFV